MEIKGELVHPLLYPMQPQQRATGGQGASASETSNRHESTAQTSAPVPLSNYAEELLPRLTELSRTGSFQAVSGIGSGQKAVAVYQAQAQSMERAYLSKVLGIDMYV